LKGGPRGRGLSLAVRRTDMHVFGIPYLLGLGLLLGAAELRSDAADAVKKTKLVMRECSTHSIVSIRQHTQLLEFLFGERKCHGGKRGQKKRKKSGKSKRSLRGLLGVYFSSSHAFMFIINLA
jgi:hypothetical protein